MPFILGGNEIAVPVSADLNGVYTQGFGEQPDMFWAAGNGHSLVQSC